MSTQENVKQNDAGASGFVAPKKRHVHITGSCGSTGSGHELGEGAVWADAIFYEICPENYRTEKSQFVEIGKVETAGKNRRECEQKIREYAKSIGVEIAEYESGLRRNIVKRKSVLGHAYKSEASA